MFALLVREDSFQVVEHDPQNPADDPLHGRGSYDFVGSFSTREDAEVAGDAIVCGFGYSKAAAALGKLGGSSRSEAKQNASRNNGKKGGRPAKK